MRFTIKKETQEILFSIYYMIYCENNILEYIFRNFVLFFLQMKSNSTNITKETILNSLTKHAHESKLREIRPLIFKFSFFYELGSFA